MFDKHNIIMYVHLILSHRCYQKKCFHNKHDICSSHLFYNINMMQGCTIVTCSVMMFGVGRV